MNVVRWLLVLNLLVITSLTGFDKVASMEASGTRVFLFIPEKFAVCTASSNPQSNPADSKQTNLCSLTEFAGPLWFLDNGYSQLYWHCISRGLAGGLGIQPADSAQSFQFAVAAVIRRAIKISLAEQRPLLRGEIACVDYFTPEATLHTCDEPDYLALLERLPGPALLTVFTP